MAPITRPIAPDDRTEGVRLLRAILDACPATEDELADAVVRRLVEGMVSATELTLEGAVHRPAGDHLT